MSHFLIRGSLEELDPAVAELVRHETARQARYLILIPSESTVPAVVRETLSSAFHNIYAEGYPLEHTRKMSEEENLDYHARLPEYRRLADNRYYKGTEYANILEALARRRTAERFATEQCNADDLYVNVQALSGAPANNAVYSALLDIGDTVMGMDLIQGGHLTHGSPVNRSGINYNIVSYGIDPATERIDYDALRELAWQHRPKMIIAGYSSYPFAPDFAQFRDIADEVGAYLLADVAHVAGLVIAGAYPNPVGIADVVSFTTHKTLNGPRGAAIITHRRPLARKIDRAVFPGEQGGPHMNAVAALAVSMRLAGSESFLELQRQTCRNALRLAGRLQELGLRLPHGGTDTHLLVVDCSTIKGEDGAALSGDMAARILDLAGIVLNRQTIPGDTSALRPGGVRIGTPWVTQRGFGDAEVDRLAEIIAILLKACRPFALTGRLRPQPRAKIDFDLLQEMRLAVRELADSAGIDTDAAVDAYPHFHDLDSEPNLDAWFTLELRGEQARNFLHLATGSNVQALEPGQHQASSVYGVDGALLSRAVVEGSCDCFRLHLEQAQGRIAAWLRALSDGYVVHDEQDLYGKLPGPVDVRVAGPTDLSRLSVDVNADWPEESGRIEKVRYIGHQTLPAASPLPAFSHDDPDSDELRRTPLHNLHQQLGARLVDFAGYDMPVWYSSVREEHQAVRKEAGLFDVAHMGVLDFTGPGAGEFLDKVTTNDVTKLAPGASQYTFLLDETGMPLDDLMIYRLTEERWLMVVNASNNEKVLAWLRAVIAGSVQIDPDFPDRRLENRDRFTLRDLRAGSSGDECRVDLALQGPRSRGVLSGLGADDMTLQRLAALPWAGVMQARFGDYDLIVSRTGYTGERVAYELFVHPDQASALAQDLLAQGATPCGLAARDSLRIEAGLPLYGHELAGPLGLNPADAGFGSYVRLYKPWFIGKSAFARHEARRDASVTRFRLDGRRARPAHQGDAFIDERGRVVGIVTSCAADGEGAQLGQAWLKLDAGRAGTRLHVVAAGASGRAEKAPRMGARVALPRPATVLSRFPRRK
ncbi:MAG: glycine cleavage system aminomethyltransferase GcvT [Anaerolineae bacterium]|nr:glycine cleavage system aminomethyltransferase GcvT [Anaerolineae bacterium]